MRDKVPINIEARGDHIAKNIARPIEVFCIIADERDMTTVTFPDLLEAVPGRRKLPISRPSLFSRSTT